ALHLDHVTKPLECRLELFLRLLLRLARIADASDENVALLDAELLHRPVVETVAAGGRAGSDEEQAERGAESAGHPPIVAARRQRAGRRTPGALVAGTAPCVSFSQ